jgi:DNA-binding transcriptional LysR family regulator
VNTEQGRPETDLDIRSLRAFVAVAEELHFTRAAARLFVAQQALSRDIRHLEDALGTPLFVRTTRRVTLTPDGTRLLERARPLLRLHDELVAELLHPNRPVLVDLMSEGRRTAIEVLEAARELAPSLEFRGRYRGGMGASIRLLETAELDVAFGRADWRGRGGVGVIEVQLVRFEPLAVLVPLGHAFAGLAGVPVARLDGVELDLNPANPDAPEWTDLVAQFTVLTGAVATPDHVPAVGLDDQAHHLVQQGLPILTSIDHVDVPGGIVVPIVDPVPVYPWSMAWRAGSHPAGLAAIRGAATALNRELGWLELPDGAWLPEPEASAQRTPTAAGVTRAGSRRSPGSPRAR